MTTIDASIPLGVKPVQIESPINQLANIAQLQGAQTQNQLLQLKMDEAQRAIADQNALRAGLSAPDADVGKVLLGRGMVDEYTKFQKAQGEAAKQKVDLVDAKLKQSRAFLDSVRTPEQYIAWHQANHADPILGPELAARGVTPEKSLASIQQAMQTPGGFEELLRKSALGLERFTELNKPTTTVVNAGGTSQVMQTPGLGGTPQTVGTVPHTPTPGAAATAAETARHHGVIEAQGAAALSKPFEVTGPDGNAVLVQQDRQGNLIPAQGYAPKGGGKPLPNAALKTITEVRDSANTIDRLASSFKPEFAEKGVMGFGAEASLTAKGVMGSDQDAVDWWKNYRKQAELVERHSMFGAALTPGEQASWRSADIGPGMHPDVIKRNLKTRQELTARMLDTTRQDLIDAGHSEQRINAIAGRGPGGSPATAPAPAAAPAPSRAAPQRVQNAADYAKVPKGAQYIAPDGQTRTKQ